MQIIIIVFSPQWHRENFYGKKSKIVVVSEATPREFFFPQSDSHLDEAVWVEHAPYKRTRRECRWLATVLVELSYISLPEICHNNSDRVVRG